MSTLQRSATALIALCSARTFLSVRATLLGCCGPAPSPAQLMATHSRNAMPTISPLAPGRPSSVSAIFQRAETFLEHVALFWAGAAKRVN